MSVTYSRLSNSDNPTGSSNDKPFSWRVPARWRVLAPSAYLR